MKNELNDLLNRLNGLETWGANSGVGTFISVEMGPHERSSEGSKSHACKHLWITNGLWSLSLSGKTISSASADKKSIEESIGWLNDSHVSKVVLDEEALKLQLTLANGTRLVVESAGDDTDEDWFLFIDDRVITSGPKGNLRVENRQP